MKMKLLFFTLLLQFGLSELQAQNKEYQLVCLAFYNFENLFDTIDSPNTNDVEFTPKGTNKYNSRIYYEKLSHLAQVVSEIGVSTTPDGAALLGVCEIENRTVLEDFVQQEQVRARHYEIIHQDSRDFRGIDVALLYQPKYFQPLKYWGIPLLTRVENGTDSSFSRDILFVRGLLNGDTVTVSVNHWPSRRGGQRATEGLRAHAARSNRRVIDSLMKANPYERIIVMGDLNDNPVDPSISQHLFSKGSKKGLKKGQFYNPYVDNFKKGIGTTAYQDAWSLFDQIILSPGFIANADESFRFYKAGIYNPRYLTQPLGQYKGYPFRTYSWGSYLGGYSDHFPVYVFLVKEAGS